MTKAGAIYVNLPVSNLKKSKDFFIALDFEFNELFEDNNGTCLVLGENLYILLLTEDFFKEFTRQEITNTRIENEVILAITLGTKNEVDELYTKALKAGAKDKTTKIPGTNEDSMYYKRIEDLDGHLWELIMM